MNDKKFPTNYKVKAIFFDMDGTIVDSTQAVERVWRNFAIRHSLNIDKVLKHIHGRRAADTVAFFTPDHTEEVAKITTEEIVDTRGIVAIPGSAELLNVLPRHIWAIVTSADRQLAIRRITAAKLPLPAVLVSAEDTPLGKPAPDGYLIAAKLLNVLPKDCLVFEDSPAGLTAAHAAGMSVIAIGNSAPAGYVPRELWIKDFTCIKFTALEPNIYQVSAGKST